MANNTYLWQEFNIKTFAAETIVYRDGVFAPELSTIESGKIDKKYDLPVHIIYVGEVLDNIYLEFDIPVPEQEVVFTGKIQNKKPVFLNILVKNTGKNSSFVGRLLLQNYSTAEVYTTGIHLAPTTKIFINTKIIAHSGTKTKLTGSAEITQGCPACDSNIGFSVLAASDAKIEFAPGQFIKSVPLSAEHSTSIYKAAPAQIEYLRTAGLSTNEIKNALEEAFINDFSD